MKFAYILHINDLTTLLIVAVALYFDLKYRRVPNFLVILGMGAGFLFSGLLHGIGGFVGGLLGLFTAALIFTPPYLAKVLGAGDVKLFCMIGVLLGPAETIIVSIYASLAGGFLVLALHLIKRLLVVIGRFSSERLPKINNFPYVSAIFSGVLIALIQKYWGVIE